jgi:hypothetical protein
MLTAPEAQHGMIIAAVRFPGEDPSATIERDLIHGASPRWLLSWSAHEAQSFIPGSAGRGTDACRMNA